MKKIYIVCMICMLLVGCRKEEIKPKKEPSFQNIEKKEERKEVPIGIYRKQNGERIKTSTYKAPFLLNKDIGVFSTFYTVEDTISGGAIKKVWNQYSSMQEDMTTYKIGYYISFEAKENHIEKNILKPEDTYSFYDYIQVYLYDDINQEEGAFYTHLEKMEENTRLTSIKLTGSTLTKEITSPITLIAFVYQKEDDFDEKGNYKGKSTFQTIIEKQE